LVTIRDPANETFGAMFLERGSAAPEGAATKSTKAAYAAWDQGTKAPFVPG
jgi:hypothetical protein